MRSDTRRWLRWSLAAVWLWTAGVSLWELNGASRQLLLEAGWHNAEGIQAVIISGALLDGLLGLALLRYDHARVYHAALGATVAMTVLGTWLLPGLWLHPLGPLLKNLPIVALLWALAQESTP